MTRSNTLPPSTNSAAPKSFHTGIRSSAFMISTALPPRGKPRGLIVSGVPTVSSAKPRMVVSPPAKNRSLAGRSSITIGGRPRSDGHRASVGWASRWKPVRQADRGARREDDPRAPGNALEPGALQVGLDEADLPAERARRHAGLAAQERAARRLDHVVAGVAATAPENADSRTCGNRRSMCACSSSLSRSSNVRWCRMRTGRSCGSSGVTPAGQFRGDAFAPEVEAGSHALLDGAGERSSRRSRRGPRLAIRAHQPVLAEARTRGRLRPDHRRVPRPEADAREQVDRTVLPAEIAPADVEEPPRRQLDALFRLAARRDRPAARW